MYDKILNATIELLAVIKEGFTKTDVLLTSIEGHLDNIEASLDRIESSSSINKKFKANYPLPWEQ